MLKILCIYFSLSVLVNSETYRNGVTSIFRSLNNLIQYYKENYMFMNLDGIYGLRLLEGQLSSLVEEFHSGNILAEFNRNTVLNQIEVMLSDTASIISSSLDHVKASDTEYFELLGPLIERKILMVNGYKLVEPRLLWKSNISHKSGYGEKFSDKCMTELMGTGNKGGESCQPSLECLQIMFQQGHTEYALTHQLLFTILATQNGCEDVLNKYLEEHRGNRDLEDIQQEFCTNNMFEMASLIDELSDKKIPVVYQDLFMEQQAVCPWLGYMQFLHGDWLDQIISWQLPSGCFGSDVEEEEKASLDEPGALKEAAEPVEQDVVLQATGPNQLLYKSGNKSQANENRLPKPGFGRSLLMDRQLADGCSAHETAVAAGALGQYLKFCLLAYPEWYSEWVSIRGPNYLLEDTWNKLDHAALPLKPHIDRQDAREVLDSPLNKDKESQRMENDAGEINQETYDDENEDKGNNEDLDIGRAVIEEPAQRGLYQPYEDGDAMNSEEDQEYQDHQEEPDELPRNYREDWAENNAIKFLPNVHRNRRIGNPDFPYLDSVEKDERHENSEDYDRYADQHDEPENVLHANNIFGDSNRRDNPKFNPMQRGDLNGPFPPIERNEDDDPGYHYYEAPIYGAAKLVLRLDKQNENLQINESPKEKVALVENVKLLNTANDDNEVSMQMQPHLPDMSVGVLYFVVLASTIVMFVFMFRFLRTKRIIIRYRYG